LQKARKRKRSNNNRVKIGVRARPNRGKRKSNLRGKWETPLKEKEELWGANLRRGNGSALKGGGKEKFKGKFPKKDRAGKGDDQRENRGFVVGEGEGRGGSRPQHKTDRKPENLQACSAR